MSELRQVDINEEARQYIKNDYLERFSYLSKQEIAHRMKIAYSTFMNFMNENIEYKITIEFITRYAEATNQDAVDVYNAIADRCNKKKNKE